MSEHKPGDLVAFITPGQYTAMIYQMSSQTEGVLVGIIACREGKWHTHWPIGNAQRMAWARLHGPEPVISATIKVSGPEDAEQVQNLLEFERRRVHALRLLTGICDPDFSQGLRNRVMGRVEELLAEDELFARLQADLSGTDVPLARPCTDIPTTAKVQQLYASLPNP